MASVDDTRRSRGATNQRSNADARARMLFPRVSRTTTWVQPSAIDRWFVAPRLRRVSSTLATRYLDRAGPYGEMIRTIDTGRIGIAEVSAIRVTDLHISKLERRAEVLRAGAAAGEEAVKRALSLDDGT